MNASLHPALLKESEIARSVNVQLIDQLPTTRAGVRKIPLDEDAESTFSKGALQGAITYNPGLGQSQQSFGKDDTSIGMVASNHLLSVSVEDVAARNTSGQVATIIKISDANIYHLSWLYQAESYLIAQDGNNETAIWDGENPAFFSTGYDTSDKPNSKIANGASVGVYAHGRIVQVVNGRKVVVGDFLHKQDRSVPTNILESTEQQYLISGSFFSPPSSMGNIMAGAILPLRDTTHGHSDVMLHCDNGVFSLDVSLPNRDEWRNQSLTKHVLRDTGARGPYAIALYDGDQIFRSRHGLQTLRSAAAESQIVGNPLRPISDPVGTWLDKDYEPYQRFTSVEKWAWQRKLFCTVAPWVQGPYRGARGAVSLNFSPVGHQSVPAAWEGLITMPPEFPNIVQFVNGVFNGQDRLFAVCSKREAIDDYTNHLVEMDPQLKHDYPDACPRRISCQLITRMLTTGNLFEESTYSNGMLYLRGVDGELDWGVWARTDEDNPWYLWSNGTVCVETDPSPTLFQELDANTAIQGFSPKNIAIPCGEAPQEVRRGKTLQILIRWKGHCSVEGFRVGFQTAPDSDEVDTPVPEGCVRNKIAGYDDFEYSSEANRWEGTS